MLPLTATVVAATAGASATTALAAAKRVSDSMGSECTESRSLESDFSDGGTEDVDFRRPLPPDDEVDAAAAAAVDDCGVSLCWRCWRD